MDKLERVPGLTGSEPRRHVTILFTDLSDSTRLSGAMEAETYAELLDEVMLVFKGIVGHHRATINQFQGDGLQALFGYPEATEHDGRRATEAALTIHERVRELRARFAAHGAADLSVHSGVHTGLTLAREGDEISGRVQLFGPAPGIAKHLSDIAGPDEILVSEETLGPGSHFFHTSERRLVLLKGRDEPLAVHRILARSSLRTRFEAHARRGLAPFIGRKADLRRLDLALDRAVRGQPQFVAIAGAAGVGKTRLAEEFLQRAADTSCSVLRGYCESELSAEPLQPFLQMLRTRFGLAHGTPAAAAAQSVEDGLLGIDTSLRVHHAELLRALSIRLDPAEGSPARASNPEATTAALCNLFAELARIRPQIVFIDDWQWSDDATRQVVHAISDLPDAPILVLAATRPPEPGDAQLSAADVLELRPFDDDEAQATVSELLPAADPFVASEIRRHSGGNPLFIEELCHSAARSGPRANMDLAIGGSAWLETLIESRVSRLPPAQADVLTAAAVIGKVVPTWLLERLTGCDERHVVVRGLADQDLLFPGESSNTLRFKHGITRDVVYASIGLQKRRAMHQTAAALIRNSAEHGSEQEACESLAYHCAGAADFELAARYAAMAGDKAMATSSIDRAKAQYRAALDMLDRLPESEKRYQDWRSVVRRLGMATVFDPTGSELELFGTALVRARERGDRAGAAYAEYWVAYISYALGESRAAVEHCELALRAATEVGDERLAVQIRATLGQALGAAGEYDGALELLDQAVAQRFDARLGFSQRSGIAYSLACKGSVLGDLGRFDEAYVCFDEALASLPWRGHEVEGSVLCWRSGVHLWRGRWDAALEDATAARRVGERVKSLYLFAMGHGLGAYARWKLEPGPGCVRDMADAGGWLAAREKNLFGSLVQGWLAEAMTASGRPVEARAHAAAALRRTRKRDWIGAAMASRAMALLAAAEHDADAAQRHLARAAAVARLRGSPHEAACNALCRAQVASMHGARELAVDSLDSAAQEFARLGMTWHLAEAERLREKR